LPRPFGPRNDRSWSLFLRSSAVNELEKTKPKPAFGRKSEARSSKSEITVFNGTQFEKTKPILGKNKRKKAKTSVNLEFIRTTIFQLLVFYACFLKQSTVTYLFVISYEAFFKKELSAFVFRRSPLFAGFARADL